MGMNQIRPCRDGIATYLLERCFEEIEVVNQWSTDVARIALALLDEQGGEVGPPASADDEDNLARELTRRLLYPALMTRAAGLFLVRPRIDTSQCADM